MCWGPCPVVGAVVVPGKSLLLEGGNPGFFCFVPPLTGVPWMSLLCWIETGVVNALRKLWMVDSCPDVDAWDGKSQLCSFRDHTGLQGASFEELTEAVDIRVYTINFLCQAFHLGRGAGPSHLECLRHQASFLRSS